MRKLIAFLGLATIACLLAWGWLRQPDNWDLLRQVGEKPTTNLPVAVLIGEQGGYLLTPPEFVAQPFIRRIEWSPDGNYAVLFQTVVRTETPTLDDAIMRHRVLLWSRKTRRLRVLWESMQTSDDMNPYSSFKIAFFGKSPACLLAVEIIDLEKEEWFSQVFYAAFEGRIATLGRFDEGVYLAAPPGDTQAYLATFVRTEQLKRLVFTPVTATGELQAPRPVAEQAEGPVYLFLKWEDNRWFEDGLQMVIPHLVLPEHVEPSNEPQNPVPDEERIAYTLWNPRTNEVSFARRKDIRYYKSSVAVPLDTNTARHKLLYGGNPAETSATWLSEGERATLIASDSTLAAVSPQGDAILYMAHGAAFYREIRLVSPEVIREMERRAERMKYLSQARQIGTALMMYVTDYDELFPPNFGSEEVASILEPYLRNAGVFRVNGVFAFYYRMDGQSLANIDSPATTEVGYLELPDGRAVIYADGHVKWIPHR